MPVRAAPAKTPTETLPPTAEQDRDRPELETQYEPPWRARRGQSDRGVQRLLAQALDARRKTLWHLQRHLGNRGTRRLLSHMRRERAARARDEREAERMAQVMGPRLDAAAQGSAERPDGTVPEAMRAPMEQALGRDLGAVRVHADARAQRLTRSFGARALTLDGSIWLGRPEGSSQVSEGTVWAHELTHVAQQRTARAGPRLHCMLYKRSGKVATREEVDRAIAEAELSPAGEAWVRECNESRTGMKLSDAIMYAQEAFGAPPGPKPKSDAAARRKGGAGTADPVVEESEAERRERELNRAWERIPIFDASKPLRDEKEIARLSLRVTDQANQVLDAADSRADPEDVKRTELLGRLQHRLTAFHARQKTRMPSTEGSLASRERRRLEAVQSAAINITQTFKSLLGLSKLEMAFKSRDDVVPGTSSLEMSGVSYEDLDREARKHGIRLNFNDLEDEQNRGPDEDPFAGSEQANSRFQVPGPDTYHSRAVNIDTVRYFKLYDDGILKLDRHLQEGGGKAATAGLYNPEGSGEEALNVTAKIWSSTQKKKKGWKPWKR